MHRDWPRRVGLQGKTYEVEQDGTVYLLTHHFKRNRRGKVVHSFPSREKVVHEETVTYLQSQAAFQ